MRSILSIALVCAVAGQLTAAQVSSMFLKTNHDFGTVARAAKTEFRFEFDNPYPQTLHVRSIRTSCGCTTPIVETDTVAPGGRGSIVARFNTGTFTGARSATLTVTFDKPSFSEVQLHVKGYIRSDIVMNPGEVSFGSVREGQVSSASIDIDYAGRSDWKIVNVEPQDSFLTARIEEVSRSGGRAKYKLMVDLNGSAPTGTIQTEVMIRTNDRNLTRVPVKVNASVQPDIAVSPQMMALGDIKPGESVRQVVIVRGYQPFQIMSIKSSEFDIQFEPSTESKPLHTLPLTISPRNGSGEVKGKIFVTTDLPGDKVVEVGAVYRVQTN